MGWEHRIAARVPAKSGTYVLILESMNRQEVKVGKLGVMRMRPGFYFYVGSALGPGGLKARLAHHARKSKSRHWHIDYVTAHTHWEEIWFTVCARKIEHQVVGLISSQLEVDLPLVGFGASDCECESHFFYASCKPSPDGIKKAIGTVGGERLIWTRIWDQKGARGP